MFESAELLNRTTKPILDFLHRAFSTTQISHPCTAPNSSEITLSDAKETQARCQDQSKGKLTRSTDLQVFHIWGTSCEGVHEILKQEVRSRHETKYKIQNIKLRFSTPLCCTTLLPFPTGYRVFNPECPKEGNPNGQLGV